MLNTFVTLEIWRQYSLYGLLLYSQVSSTKKMQKIFADEETKVCWSYYECSKNDNVFHFKCYNLPIYIVKKINTILLFLEYSKLRSYGWKLNLLDLFSFQLQKCKSTISKCFVIEHSHRTLEVECSYKLYFAKYNNYVITWSSWNMYTHY